MIDHFSTSPMLCQEKNIVYNLATLHSGLIWMFLWSYCILVFFLLQMTLSSSVSQNTYLRLFQIASHLVMCLRVSFIINRFHFPSSLLVELLFWKTLCNCGNFQLAQLKLKNTQTDGRTDSLMVECLRFSWCLTLSTGQTLFNPVTQSLKIHYRLVCSKWESTRR